MASMLTFSIGSDDLSPEMRCLHCGRRPHYWFNELAVCAERLRQIVGRGEALDRFFVKWNEGPNWIRPFYGAHDAIEQCDSCGEFMAAEFVQEQPWGDECDRCADNRKAK